jgi:head-tail adaptor
MVASDLREWVALFLMDLTPDGQGGYREVPPAGLAPDRPANVRQIAAQEVFASDQTADRVRYEITIRYEPAINTQYRVLWRDQYLDVTAISNAGIEDTWLKLTCERKESGTQ